MNEPAWKEQLRIALTNTIRNEIITASGDGVAKPSQYLDGCVKSILEQISFSEVQINRELIILTDVLGFDEDKHMDIFNKTEDFIKNYCIDVEHKYV